MTIEIKDIKKIAKLARIEMNEEDLHQYKDDLSEILALMEQLQKVDTDNVEPMTSAYDMNLRMRKDEVTDGGYPKEILSNAVDSMEDYFTVPKVVE